MVLREYLKNQGIKIVDFIKITKLSERAIRNAMNGVNIRRRTARIIYRKTNRVVKLREDIS